MLNEHIVEYTAIEWFGELGYAVGHGPLSRSMNPVASVHPFGDLPKGICGTKPLTLSNRSNN